LYFDPHYLHTIFTHFSQSHFTTRFRVFSALATTPFSQGIPHFGKRKRARQERGNEVLALFPSIKKVKENKNKKKQKKLDHPSNTCTKRNNTEVASLSMSANFTEDLEHGPLSVLVSAIKTNSQVLVNCRNNRKLLGRIKAFDRHLNLLLENVKEVWTERNGQKESRMHANNKDRFISKLFLRGDSIILVLSNPK